MDYNSYNLFLYSYFLMLMVAPYFLIAMYMYDNRSFRILVSGLKGLQVGAFCT